MVDKFTDATGTPDKHRILAFLPLPYGDDWGFWNRDLGLLVRGFRSSGHDAWLVAFKDSTQIPGKDKPVIVATKRELEDPQWWQKQQPDAIILNMWSATRHHAIRMAALSVKKPLIEKLDTDGVKSPRVWPYRYMLRDVVDYKHSDPFYKKVKAFSKALARTIVVGLFPSVLDAKMVRGMSCIPVYAAETPLAVARVKRFLRIFKASPMPRVITIPHPANTSQMRLLPTDQKENIVISVGRWDEAVKGWPLLFDIAKRFLRIRPDWKMVVVGPEPSLHGKDRRELETLREHLIIAGSLQHEQLSAWYRKAKIYLLTSHAETFNIAAAEALCCGCSVVAPSQIASASYFAGWQSGTPSHQRSADHMTDALLAEVDEWESGRRDPFAIAQAAIQNLSVEAVTLRYLQIFKELEKQP